MQETIIHAHRNWSTSDARRSIHQQVQKLYRDVNGVHQEIDPDELLTK